MNVSVMLEQVGDSGYRATVFAPAPLVAEAASREQAVERIRQMIRERLSQVELIQVEVPGLAEPSDPWIALAGTWRGHPDALELEQHLRDYRHDVNADPGRL